MPWHKSTYGTCQEARCGAWPISRPSHSWKQGCIIIQPVRLNPRMQYHLTSLPRHAGSYISGHSPHRALLPLLHKAYSSCVPASAASISLCLRLSTAQRLFLPSIVLAPPAPPRHGASLSRLMRQPLPTLRPPHSSPHAASGLRLLTTMPAPHHASFLPSLPLPPPFPFPYHPRRPPPCRLHCRPPRLLVIQDAFR